MSVRTALHSFVSGFILCAISAGAATIWVEGEKPASSKVTRHPWWYDQVQVKELSGGDYISHWDKEKAGEAVFAVQASQAGSHELWVRANPVQATMSYSVNGGEALAVPLKSNEQSINIAADEKPDLRFIAWIKVGTVALNAGANTVTFRFTSANNHHGMLDCFVLSNDGFQPDGIRRPGDGPTSVEEGEWFAFNPSRDTFWESAIDLRWLNEKLAGEHGRIATRGDEFVHSGNGRAVRFWAVNGPPHEASGEALKLAARRLAKYGVNLVRPHGAVFDKAGEVDLKKVAHLQEVVAEMKAQGIYSHLSFYFPLWFTPGTDHPWLKGYDGKTHPFAALMFNPEFQAKHREWMRVMLTTPDRQGRKLIDEPAVFGLEIQNEDSFFFWTFNDKIPDVQLRILERQFGEWLKRKHGTIDAAFAKWNGQSVKRDAVADGRVGIRPLWNIFNEKSARDRDTAAFLFETQERFYADSVAYLRGLGFKGLVTPSNWTTASPEVFGPLEKWSYTTGDFVDRHGYFAGTHQGENAAWSLRAGHTYSDRSALRFDAGEPGKPKQFNHPVMDPTYAGKPSMISETTWNRPNRYRTEAPLYLAIYGALQGSDAIVHFAFDGVNWSTKPNFWMQPWTLMAPSQVGQFPAAALIYRQGLVSMGETLARVNLNTNDLLNLKGTPLPQDASFDELRLKDVPQNHEVKPGQRIDPLIHYAGRTEVNFSAEPSRADVKDLGMLIDRKAQVVRSSTGEVKLDYGRGMLLLNAAAAQGASGNLKAGGLIALRDIEIECDLDLAHIVVVSLDGQPLSSARRMLLQVITEEKNSGFQTAPDAQGMHRVKNVGRDPWMVKEIRGAVKFKKSVVVQPLDFNGYPSGDVVRGAEVRLGLKTMYYLVELLNR